MIAQRLLGRAGTVVMVAVVMVVVACLVGVMSARAEVVSPWWGLTMSSTPTSLTVGGSGTITVSVENLGDASADGSTSPVRVEDVLPAGLRATSIEGHTGLEGTTSSALVKCSPDPASERPLSCTYTGVLSPYDSLSVTIGVSVQAPPAAGEESVMSVSGGGSP